jgi:glycosyltransferase involved in cell wall biosynthesis
MSEAGRPVRVAVVAPIMVRYDAISLAARDTVRAFATDRRFTVQHFGCACDFPEVVHRPCGGVAELLLDPQYQAADVAIFHFGVHHSLFDALLAGGPPVRIVRFHNVTPAHFVSPRDVPIIERSLLQVETLRHADEIWADSPSNAQELLDRGFDPARLRVIPLVVEDPPLADFIGKPEGPVRILFVGRFAPSKGLHDLVAAIARLRLPRGAVQVTLAGNTAWSEPDYLARIRGLIAAHGLGEVVHFAGTVDDTVREALFHAAHVLAIPSYHEGFCRPVAEGLRAGCIPVVYDAYNLPHIAGQLGRVVPAGDVRALAAALEALARAIPPALAQPAEPLLPIDCGPVSAFAFGTLAHQHTAGFAFAAIAGEIRQRLLDTLSRQAPGQPPSG